ncbi:DUF3616 domain-containing protein [candidate division KSB1 bacterium]|nr:DUF3616 domain-containing protein [candidate division KSB1 bacterium]
MNDVLKMPRLFVALLWLLHVTLSVAEVTQYYEMCDASAALPVDEEHFIIANDEDNLLRIYHYNEKMPVRTFDLSAFLGIKRGDKSPESDIEGAAKIDDYNFFITSHGRDKKGRLQKNRQQFFAVKIDRQSLQIKPVGRPYQHLLDEMVRMDRLKKLGVYDSYQPSQKKNTVLAPKELGVNIEGLAAAPDRRSLLIGFRNPVPGGEALVIELLNPVAVVTESASPRFGEIYLLDMDDRGIRSLEYDPQLNDYLVIGGAQDDEIDAKLYLWNARAQGAPVEIAEVDFRRYDKLTPEAMFTTHQNRLQIFSDDGTIKHIDATGDKCDCKQLPNAEMKNFRRLQIEWPAGRSTAPD